jgi:phage protein D
VAEAVLSEGAVYSARPSVRVAGRANEKVSELLISMDMVEEEGGMSALELRFSNIASTSSGDAELAFEDASVLTIGAVIDVAAGDEESPKEIFKGVITAIELDRAELSAPELVVFAEDAFQRARMKRRTEIHKNATIQALADKLAETAGLSAKVQGFSGTIGTWAQVNESDLAFFRRVLARYNGDLQVVGGDLQVTPRTQMNRGQIDLEMGSQLTHARVLADLAHQVTQVTVSGWDVTKGTRISASSTGASLGAGSGTAGSKFVKDWVQKRSEHVGEPGVLTRDEATALADAAFDARARAFVTIDGTAEGNAELRVGTEVKITRLSPRFDNTYSVVRARHRFDGHRGYQTDFRAECAYLAQP